MNTERGDEAEQQGEGGTHQILMILSLLSFLRFILACIVAAILKFHRHQHVPKGNRRRSFEQHSKDREDTISGRVAPSSRGAGASRTSWNSSATPHSTLGVHFLHGFCRGRGGEMEEIAACRGRLSEGSWARRGSIMSENCMEWIAQ